MPKDLEISYQIYKEPYFYSYCSCFLPELSSCRPAAFLVGDEDMVQYTQDGNGVKLSLLILHDDADREYAYGPALGLPKSDVGTFTSALYEEAIKNGWIVISLKNDWKRIF